MKKILIYDDNPDFGGHQVMAAYAVEALAESPEFRPLFFLNPANAKLRDRLEAIAAKTGNLELRESPLKTVKLQGLLNYFIPGTIRELAELLQAEKPELVLCIQGEIEDSSMAVLAARRAGLQCLSYIPVPHPMKRMGARLGGLRDRINRPLFNRPDGYITISETMRDLLRERGCTQPVDVVWNGIETERFTRHMVPADARKELNLPDAPVMAGLIGRIEFNQKQQDFTVQTWHRRPDVFGHAHLVMVGDGPDRPALETQIQQLDLQDRVTLLPWQDDPVPIYSALDLLLIPSRFEGVPLVMLEALCFGLPVIGSDRDGMRDLLPEAWRFEPENEAALAETFRRVTAEPQDQQIKLLSKKIREEMNILSFKSNFTASVLTFKQGHF